MADALFELGIRSVALALKREKPSPVAVPVDAGLVMALVGRLRSRHGKEIIRLDTFVYGFIFALAMTLIRFVWAK